MNNAGFIVAEMEGKWPVIGADEGKEPVRFTASNSHLGMVALLDRSARPKRKRKKRSTNHSTDMTKNHQSRGSEEDLFLACLAKQVRTEEV